MKRRRDDFSRSESQKQRRVANLEEAFSGEDSQVDELHTQIDEQKEPASSHELKQVGKETWECTKSEEDSGNPLLLGHLDPQVRLRSLACLYAHIDLFSCDPAGTEHLFEALYRRLHREENVHVAQQIVRLLASLVISTCKFGARQKSYLESSPISTSAKSEHRLVIQGRESGSNPCCILGASEGRGGFDVNDSSHYDGEDGFYIPFSCNQSAFRKASSVGPKALLPTPERVEECITMLMSYVSAEKESPVLKLQVLRCLQEIAEEAIAVRYSLLREHLPELLASSNPFIRGQTLQVVALSLVTDPDSKSLFGKADVVGLFFVEYFHDTNAVVRKASLQSIIHLCTNGYFLTEGCYKAAVILLEDANETVRSLALRVVSLWVKQDPGERTNIAFLEVCKMMTDMELSVRIEACRAFLTMKNVSEDLLLQALSKQPLKLSNEVKELQPSSLITISESDVDISKYEEGLKILDRLNMGAFVHGVEDEFFEVRALTLNALAHFCCVSTRACGAIEEVMLNLLNDDSNVVRLKAVQTLISMAHHYGLKINDNDLHIVYGILEDVDEAIRDAGKALLSVLRHLSVDGLKYTIKSLMKLMQRNQQHILSMWPLELNSGEGVWHALYNLGRAHSAYVQLLAKDLLKELKASLSGEAGLDAPECGCLLSLFVGASETNSKILSIIPSQILSLAQLFKQSKIEMDIVLKSNLTESPRLKTPRGVLGISSEHKQEINDFLARMVRTSCNVKKMLVLRMFSTSRKVLRGCRRDMKRLISMLDDEDQVALTTYVLHYVECIYLVWQGWFHFHRHEEALATASTPSLSELACRLDFVVNCMRHTYLGHKDEQKLDLDELSLVPALWRMISIAASRSDHKELVYAVETIESTMRQSSSSTPFMGKIQKNLLEAFASSINVQTTLCELASSFWPQPLTISYLREVKAVLSIPQNDLEHPIEFLPNMPFGIMISILTQNLDNGRMWVRICLEPLWTKFMFLECRRANPLVTTLIIPGLSVYSNCTLEAAVYLECPGASEEVGRGPTGYLLPLTPDKLIHLMPASLG